MMVISDSPRTRTGGPRGPRLKERGDGLSKYALKEPRRHRAASGTRYLAVFQVINWGKAAGVFREKNILILKENP